MINLKLAKIRKLSTGFSGTQSKWNFTGSWTHETSE